MHGSGCLEVSPMLQRLLIASSFLLLSALLAACLGSESTRSDPPGGPLASLLDHGRVEDEGLAGRASQDRGPAHRDLSAGDPDVGTGGHGPGGDAGSAPGTIRIYVEGDLSTTDFHDGLVGQTPRDYEVAVSRYSLLRSADDPSPALCFDHGDKVVVAKMHRDNLIGFCRTANLPSATYTHGRTKVVWARYTVDAVYHALGLPHPGAVTFFRAFSDTEYGGKPYEAGQGTISFKGATSETELPVSYGPMPDSPGLVTASRDGELTVTFPYTTSLPVDAGNTSSHWARFHWRTKESFRWVDRRLPGYEDGVWDISSLAANNEEVRLHGVAGYYVSSSVD
jgi:hypothetical protein